MMTSEQVKMMLDGVKGLVMNCKVNILVLKVLGEYHVYIARDVRLKTRECRYNEVLEAQDITVLVKNVGINFAQGMTNQSLMEKAQSIHKENFKFGTDDYMWFTKVDLNRG